MQNWNDGKAQEFRDRMVYDAERSCATHSYSETVHGAKASVAAEPEKASQPDARITLFASHTCPSCKRAQQLLTQTGIPHALVYADAAPEAAAKLNIRQVPTLISGENRYTGLAAVQQFIATCR